MPGRSPTGAAHQLAIPHTVHTLDNGLTVFVHEDARTPIACLNIWYRVGSKDERPGRTGFAHLFEHLMFEGSLHVPKGRFDELLENAGGTNNGSTSSDRTNYWETVPSGALALALHLESDRMGWFLETITQEKLDGQRDVVKNERRQSYDNRPYGLAWETLMKTLYPADHPYHWPVIGWMEDLDAASLEDVQDFFRKWYAPNNATLAIAGDVEAAEVIDVVMENFADIPRAPVPERTTAVDATLATEQRVVLEDDVHLPRIYMAWHTPPMFAPGDAAMDIASDVLGAGKAARLYTRLVHELEIAQDVAAFQDSGKLGSTFALSVTAREGIELERIEGEVRSILEAATRELSTRELERSRNHIETNLIDSLQHVGGFDGKADRLNHYHFYTGSADYLARDFARYAALDVEQVRAELARTIATPPAVVSVIARRAS